MRLTSCESCGVVLDLDNVEPSEDSDVYVKTVSAYDCPVCGVLLLRDKEPSE